MAGAQSVVKYEPAEKDLKYVYATVPPVMTLKSGEILDTRTFDCFGNASKKPGDTLALAKGDNPLTGPFAIAGAEPGDTIAVKILALTVDSDRGVGALAPGFGALNSTNYTPMLNAHVPEKIWFYDIDHADGEIAGTAIEVPMRVRLQVELIKGKKIGWPRLENDTSLMARPVGSRCLRAAVEGGESPSCGNGRPKLRRDRQHRQAFPAEEVEKAVINSKHLNPPAQRSTSDLVLHLDRA